MHKHLHVHDAQDPTTTKSTPSRLPFHPLGRRDVVARFDGGPITSNGGVLALREVDRRIGLSDRLGRCFRDFRNPNSVEHPVRDLAAQRVHAQALGYEDLHDHDPLCREPLLAVALGRQDALGGGCGPVIGVVRWPLPAR